MVSLPCFASMGSFEFFQDKNIQFHRLFIDAKAQHIDQETQVNHLDGLDHRDDGDDGDDVFDAIGE